MLVFRMRKRLSAVRQKVAPPTTSGAPSRSHGESNQFQDGNKAIEELHSADREDHKGRGHDFWHGGVGFKWIGQKGI